MQRAPLLLPATAFLLAIVAEAHSFTLAAALSFGGLAMFRRDIAIGGACGLLIGHMHGHPAVVASEQPTSRFAGTIVGDVRATDSVEQFPFAIAGLGTLRATAHGRVSAGERLTVRARIAPLDEPRNPGESSARAIALDEGIVGEVAIERILSRAPPDYRDARVWMPLLRARASHDIRTMVPEPQATVLAGALWGERSTLPQAIRADFQATGTVHVLVTAGLHLGVIAAVMACIFGLLRAPRVIASLGTIPVIYAYAALSGWHLPSQRAAAMLTVALVARACGARPFTLNTLAIAAIVIGASWPVAVESVSFAMSFSCVGAIVLFVEPIGERLAALRLPAAICETLSLTLATQIGVWPLTAAVFFTVAPYAIVANAIVVPFVGVAMVLGIATLCTQPLLSLSAVLARWDTWLLSLILEATRLLAALPGARLTITPPPQWSIVMYDAAIVAAATLLRRHLRLAVAIGLGASLLVVVAALHRPEHRLTITALDVGQGDALVIQTPHGRTIVIDTGGRLERGATLDERSPAERSADRIVLPYLQRAGISRVDMMVLTHPHGDHVGGALGILTLVPVGWIADSGQVYGGRAYGDTVRAAAVHRVPVVVPHCRQRFADDGVTFTFLSPCGSPFVDGKNDVNENSLVVLLQYGSFRMLFMGDAGFAAEQRLLAQRIDLNANVLKVGHHGSAYSSSPEFLRAVHPRIAVISVGRHNLFGHPARSTLETLERTGARTYRTDRCGAVSIAVDSVPTVTTMLHCNGDVFAANRSGERSTL